MSSNNFIKGLQSLQQRYLVKKIKKDQILFTFALLFKEYLKIFVINSINSEEN